MIDGPALQVAAESDARHDGTAERVARAPAQRGQLVAELVVGGPDVVEELDFDDGLQAPRGEPDRPTHDVGFRERRVVHPVAPELALQPPGDLEHAALPLHLAEALLAARVGPLLAADDDPRIAWPLGLQAGA